jgi:hypothetical protein
LRTFSDGQNQRTIGSGYLKKNSESDKHWVLGIFETKKETQVQKEPPIVGMSNTHQITAGTHEKYVNDNNTWLANRGMPRCVPSVSQIEAPANFVHEWNANCHSMHEK